MILLFTGGRDYQNYDNVFYVINKINNKTKINLIIHGATKGLDSLVEKVCLELKINTKKYPVTNEDWIKYGKYAGQRRNKIMLDENPSISAIIVFPGGKGTAGMKQYAIQKKYKVIEIE